LLDLGADTQAANQITGATPLHCAVQSSKADLPRRILCVQKLLEAGANPSMGDHYGEIPFGYCDDPQLKDMLAPVAPLIFKVMEEARIEALKALVEEDPSCINARHGGKTPMLAILGRLLDLDTQSKGDAPAQLQILELLLDHGADPNASPTTNRGGHLLPQDEPDDPPLLQVCLAVKGALQQDKTERLMHLVQVAQLLVAKEAKLTPAGEQLLHDAARRNQVEMAKFLIETIGVSVNVAGRQGMTPIQFAARSGKLEMIHFLLDQEGIDVSIADERGQTALDAAKINGKDEILVLLQAHQKERSN
jgi:ankyrin repeat protein